MATYKDLCNPLPKFLPITETALQATVLTPEAFAPFGTVVQNPSFDSPGSLRAKPASDSSNQGSATVYAQISTHDSLLEQSESQVPGHTTFNLYECRARKSLYRPESQITHTTYAVPVLERHPYTTQSFLPLGLAAHEARQRAYLVIVAPTLPANPGEPLRYRTEHGGPDLSGVKAFFAHGGQGVTYSAGTWHSPMIAIGGTVDFVVLQWHNDIAIEGCQEIAIGDESAGLRVEVSTGLFRAAIDADFRHDHGSKL